MVCPRCTGFVELYHADYGTHQDTDAAGVSYRFENRSGLCDCGAHLVLEACWPLS